MSIAMHRAHQTKHLVAKAATVSVAFTFGLDMLLITLHLMLCCCMLLSSVCNLHVMKAQEHTASWPML